MDQKLELQVSGFETKGDNNMKKGLVKLLFIEKVLFTLLVIIKLLPTFKLWSCQKVCDALIYI